MEALDLEVRRKIYQTILRNPGLHLREIQRRTGLAMGMLTYHLDVLENTGFIRTELKEKKKCYFPYAFSYTQSSLIMFMRETLPRKILLLLLEKPRRFGEIVETLGRSKSVVSTHITRMIKAGIIVTCREENENLYSLKEPAKVKETFITYRESFYDEALDRFIDLYLEM
ncbi:MAG: helix-turn-helix domain-containing protein [Thermoplasmata archaeon]|nr:helix-turn-helix domain-containing protein [Thermoplasmata archaeon]